MAHPQPRVIQQQGGQQQQQAMLQHAAQGFANTVMNHRQQEHAFRMDNIQNEMAVIELGLQQYHGDIAAFSQAHPEIMNSFLGHLYDGDQTMIANAYRNLTEVPATASQIAAQGADALARGDINEARRAFIDPPAGTQPQQQGQNIPASLRPGPDWRDAFGIAPRSDTPEDAQTMPAQPTSSPTGDDITLMPAEATDRPVQESDVQRLDTDSRTGAAASAQGGVVFEPPTDVAGVRAQREELEQRMNELRELNPEEAERVYEYYQQLGEYEQQLEFYTSAVSQIQDARSGSGTRRAAEIQRELAPLREELEQLGTRFDPRINSRRTALQSQVARLEQERTQLTQLSQAPMPKPPQAPSALSIAPRPPQQQAAQPTTAQVQTQRNEQLAQTPTWDRESQRMLRDAGATAPQQDPTPGTRSFTAPETITTPQDFSEAQQQEAQQTAQEVAENPTEPLSGQARPYLTDFHISGTMEPRAAREFQRDTAADMRSVRREFRADPELREGSVRQAMAERAARVLTELHNPNRAAIWDAIEPPQMAKEREARFRRQLDMERLDLDIQRFVAGHDLDLARLDLAEREFGFRIQQAELAMHAAMTELPPSLQWHWKHHSSIQQSLIDGLIREHGDNPTKLNREFEKLITTDVWKTSQGALEEMGQLAGFGPGITQVLNDGGFFQRIMSMFGRSPDVGWREPTPEERRDTQAPLQAGPDKAQAQSQAEQYLRMQNMIP